MPSTPKNILYVRADSFGDLILFTPALSEIIKHWPGARHTLLVRSGYDSLRPLFLSELHWEKVPLNPFKQTPTEALNALNTLLRQLEANPPDLIIAATLNRTWLETAIAAHFPQARRVALGGNSVDPIFAKALQLELNINAAGVFTEIVPAEASAPDWENNLRLADHLLGAKATRQAPSLTIPSDAQVAAAALLKTHQLSDRTPWVACYPAGVANVRMKAWPAERFAETICWLQTKHQLGTLLLGHQSEAAIVNEVADLVQRAGSPRPPVWLSQDGEISLMAGMLARARFYLGNDTGPMHLAASIGTPVIGIFGGGYWPRFKPVGHQTVSVVQPLPCFGCSWDCHFGNAPCVKTIPVADLQTAVGQLLGKQKEKCDLVIEARALSADSLDLIAQVTPVYRQNQRDRQERQHKIEELTHLGREKDTEIADLKQAAEERKQEMESIKAELEAECAQKDSEIAGLKAEANTKDAEINSLKAETNTKDSEIDSLKHEADTKDAEIGQLKTEANTKDSEIDRLKGVCNEREELIFKLDKIVKGFQQQVADLSATIASLNQSLAANDTELARLQAHFAALPPEASQYGQWLHDKDVHIRNLEQSALTQDRAIKELRASLDNYANGYGELEQVKRYGRWLHEKESAIQQLKRACDEREALIQRLVATTAGLGRVQQLWFAMREHVRQKYWIPCKDAIFRKVVEQYEMQLGVLRHHDPRPIQWDLKLPKRGRLPDDQLPAIVIVTPSYNQDKFLESTLLSVLNQNYPKLRYHVQDGASRDGSIALIERYAGQLSSWQSVRDKGQADAILRGFSQLPAEDSDIMAWLNSDDLIAPRALRFVAEYFQRHPEVDAVYGHRIIIDDHNREIGRWVMPPHDPATLEWIDYVPQETLFYRRRLWKTVGGIDPSFQFALDWDLLARFQSAGARIVRLPYFLGCFRLHSEQKTSAQIHTTGHEEMTRIRTRIHGPNPDPARIEHFARKARFTAAITARLHKLGLRF